MADIAPELYEAIKADFEKGMNNREEIKGLYNRIRDGTPKLEECHDFAEALGHNLSEAFIANITEDALPGGKMYWNIAERTVKPMLEQNHALVNDAAKQVQAIIDEKENIGISPVSGKEPDDRIYGLMNKICDENNTFEQMLSWLEEPIINCTEAFFDEFVRANADFRSRAGMSPRIVRKLESSGIRTSKKGWRYRIPCEWCRRLAGAYDYDTLTNDDVYKRHEYCRCTVTFENGKERQDVWSKKKWQESEDVLNTRKTIGLEIDRR